MELSELLYEVALRITGVVDYGANLQAIAAGKAAPPPEGLTVTPLPQIRLCISTFVLMVSPSFTSMDR